MRALVTMLMAVMLAVGHLSSAAATGDLLGLTNADRVRNGLSPLTGTAELHAYAQSWAQSMMRAGVLSHTPDLRAAVPNSVFVAENVGQGASLTQIQSAFMASPAHRANILRPEYSQAGVGVAWDGVDLFYVAVIFRQPPVATAPEATPAPAPAPKAKPAPAPRRTSSPPTTARPPAASAPRAAMSTPTTAKPSPPPPPPEPAVVEHPAPLAPQAGPRLSWVLAATTGERVSEPDSPNGAIPARVVATSTASAAEDGSSSLLLALALLAMVYASTTILAEAHRRFAPTALRLRRTTGLLH